MTVSNFGAATVLVNGQIQLKLPPKCSWWYLQNQSTSPLQIQFISQDWGVMSTLILAAAAYPGAPGGYLDSLGFPYFGEQGVVLTSTDASAPFGSGSSPDKPPTNFVENATGPTSFG